MTLGDRVAVLKGCAATGGDAAGALLRIRGQPVRRRVHRVTADELRPGPHPRWSTGVAVRLVPVRSDWDHLGSTDTVFIAGIRPGSFEDATLVDPKPRPAVRRSPSTWT